jgi:hypothetical protein
MCFVADQTSPKHRLIGLLALFHRGGSHGRGRAIPTTACHSPRLTVASETGRNRSCIVRDVLTADSHSYHAERAARTHVRRKQPHSQGMFVFPRG